MPPVIGAVAAGAVAAASATGITIFGTTFIGLSAGLIVGASSFALSMLQGALAEKPKNRGLSSPESYAGQASNQTQQILQPLGIRKPGYGEVRRSGTVLYGGSSSNGLYLHLIVEVGDGEVEEIGEIWMDDVSIPPDYLDGSGNVTQGRYAGHVRIKKYLGLDTQTVDPDLMSAMDQIEATDRLRGIPYIYIRYKDNRELFPSGRPDVSAWVRQRKVIDVRTAPVPAIIGVSTGSGKIGTVPFSRPVGTVNGVGILLWAGSDYPGTGNTEYTPPAGFLPVDDYARANDGSAGVSGQLFWKVANGEPDTYTLTENSNKQTQVICVAVSGIYGADAIEDFEIDTASSGEPVCPSVTSLSANALIIHGAVWDQSKTLSGNPAGTTEAAHVDQEGLDTSVVSKSQAVAGASGTATYDISSGTNWVTFSIALKPDIGERKWTTNLALIARDFLTDKPFGLEAKDIWVDDAATAAAANICDEIVETVPVDMAVSSVAASSDLLTLSGADLLPFTWGDQVECLTTGVLPAGLSGGRSYYVIPYQRKGNLRIKLADSLDDSMAGTAVDITGTGSGAHTIRKIGEARYHGGGIVDREREVGSNMLDILSGLGGADCLVRTGKTWRILPAVYRSPSIVFDESHLRAPLRVRPLVSKADIFNTVKGVYVSPLHGGQPSDYPAWSNSAHVEIDGEKKVKDLPLPYIQIPSRGQRLVKIRQMRHRQEQVVEYPMNLHGLRVRAGDTVMISNTRRGWNEKVFEVREWKLVVEQKDGVPLLGVDLLLQETASEVFDWNNGDEVAVDPAPNTSLPSPFSVSVPVGVSLDSLFVETRDGDRTFKIKVSLDSHLDSFVRNKGKIEIQYRESGNVVWKDFPPVDGAATETELFQAALGLLYDIRVRAVNSLGVPSAWVTFEGFMVGSSVITDTEDWENEALASEDYEADTATSEDWET